MVALDALLTTRSITRAAQRMNLSQPAMSAALGRLRDYFDDPLLVLNGKRFQLTATAETLLPLIRQWLRDTDALIAATQRFDPASSQRTFRIVASDYTAVILLTRLAAKLHYAAPRVRLDISSPFDGSTEEIEAGTADLLIGPDSVVVARHPTELLFEEQLLVVGWAENPLFDGPLTEAAFLETGHVVVAFGLRREAPISEQALEKLGIIRRVEVTTSTFTSLPWFLPGTMRLALLPERLARFFAEIAPLRMAEPPFSVPKWKVMVQYHSTRRTDPGLAWLRGLIQSSA